QVKGKLNVWGKTCPSLLPDLAVVDERCLARPEEFEFLLCELTKIGRAALGYDDATGWPSHYRRGAAAPQGDVGEEQGDDDDESQCDASASDDGASSGTDEVGRSFAAAGA
ncbi:unnamed protein product, partial [Prorocentrum cordatum]